MSRILIIDDDDDLRPVLISLLLGAGHTVDEARNGRVGLELYQAGHHDLIITDIVMPEMEGLELIAALRHSAPRPRLIAISGTSKFSDSVYLPIARHLGAQRILGKPISPHGMLEAVAAVLAGPPPPPVPVPVPGPTSDGVSESGSTDENREPPRSNPSPDSRPEH